MPRRSAAAALAMLLASGFAASAQQQPPPPQPASPLAVYQGFVASRAVAERCNALDPVLEPPFQANLATVAARAREALVQMLPPERQGELPRIFANMSEAVKARIVAAVEERGCDAEGPRQMVAQYRALAGLRLAP